MAMFHFRLKLDKKPSGTKISAVKHVEYMTKCAPLQDRRIRRNKEHRARTGSDGKCVIDNNIDCADVSLRSNGT